jgi:hypothetical protein
MVQGARREVQGAGCREHGGWGRGKGRLCDGAMERLQFGPGGPGEV